MMNSQGQRGTVKWFDPNKGFGFIETEGGEDVFIHCRNVLGGRDALIEGQKVELGIRPSAKGMEAYDVLVVQESAAPPRKRTVMSGAHSSTRDAGRPFRPRSDDANVNAPRGPITCKVTTYDPDGRFMFVRGEVNDVEVYVHSSLFRVWTSRPRSGDAVTVTVERGAKGLRATSIERL